MNDRFRSVSVSPLPGVKPDNLIRAVEDHAREAGNLPGRTEARLPVDAFNAYLRWANQAARHLATLVAARDVERLILTPRHWALQSLDPIANGDLLNLVRLELEQRKQALDEVATDLRTFVDQWRLDNTGTLVVPDTNFYLHNEHLFKEISWRQHSDVGNDQQITLVVPLIVVDELDRAKRDDIRTRARLTLRQLHDMFADPSKAVSLAEPNTQARLLLDPPGHVRLADADAEIVDRASALAALSQLPTVILTYDVGMSLRAKAAELDVRWFPRPDPPAKQRGKRTR